MVTVTKKRKADSEGRRFKATLIAKHCKSFTEGEFIKDCVMKMVEKICPDEKQDLANVCLARNIVVWENRRRLI